MSDPRNMSEEDRRRIEESLVGKISEMHARTRPPVGSAIRKVGFDGSPAPSTVPATDVGPSYMRYFGQAPLDTSPAALEAVRKRLDPLTRSNPADASAVMAECAAAALNARISAVRRASDPAAAVTAIRKAKGRSMMPVYNEAGKLVAMADPDDLIPLAEVPGASSKAQASPVPPLPPTVTDLTPAPASAAGVGADAVAKRR